MARHYGSAVAFKTSLEAYLRKLAGERNAPLSTLQLKLVIERLLEHSSIDHHRCIRTEHDLLIAELLKHSRCFLPGESLHILRRGLMFLLYFRYIRRMHATRDSRVPQ